MLENLDNVNWTELGAPQIPELLWEIQTDLPGSGNDKKRQETWNELRELLYPEGIIDNWDWGGPGRMMQNDLPHHTVPFLLEILEYTTSKSNQSTVIDLLWQLCTYPTVKLWVGDPGEPRYEEYVRWADRLKEVIRQGIPLYKQLLDDPYPYLDANVRELLKKLDEV
jgi:hypothetical protein